MLTILSIIIPFFAVIACGYGAGRFSLLGDASRVGLNSFVFYFALPVLLFSLMARADIAARFDWMFVGAYLAVSVGLFVIMLAVARALFRLDIQEGAIFALSGVYGNVGYVGIPLVVVAFGHAASIPVIVCLTLDLAIMIPLAIVLIEAQQEGGVRLRQVFSKSVLVLVKNPLIVAITLGVVVSLSGVQLPDIAANFTTLLGVAAAPCALFALGLSLVGRPLTASLVEISFITVVKLTVHPLAVWFAMFHIFVVDPDWALAAVIASTMPVAATVFVVAQQYQTYVVRSSSAILVSTALSVVTIFAFVAYFTPTFLQPAP